jgi:hypothetical protein
MRKKEQSQKELLVGNWEWISSTGGIDGRTKRHNLQEKTSN